MILSCLKKVPAYILMLFIGLITLIGTSIQPVYADTVITAVYSEFTETNLEAFNLVGNAELSGSSVRLTPSEFTKYGAMWWDNKITLADERSFSAYFCFTMSDSYNGGADGLVFAIQTQSNGAGSSGGGMSYGGITPSIGVEFDTYYNSDISDPNGNHVGLDVNGSIESISSVSVDSIGLLENGTYYCWVDYDGDTDDFQVRLSTGSTRPSSAILSKEIDLTTIIGEDVYLGFTAATGGSCEIHQINSFYFNNDYISGGINPGSETYTGAPTTVTLSASPSSITAGGSTGSTISATVKDADGELMDGQTITFNITSGSANLSSSSAVTDVSGVASVTLTGTSAGEVTVRGSATGGAYGETSVTLNTIVIGVDCWPDSALIVEGRTQMFTPYLLLSDDTSVPATDIMVTEYGLSLNWSVSYDTPTVTWDVDDLTNINTVTGLEPGTAVVTAKLYYTSEDYYFDESMVNVTSAVLDEIVIEPDDTTLARGLTQQYTATGIFSDDTEADITEQVVWSVEHDTDPSTTNGDATIENNGLLTADKVGDVLVKASLYDVEAETTLRITARVMTGIDIYPQNAMIYEGYEQQYTAYVNYSYGDPDIIDAAWLTAHPTAELSWSTDDEGVATFQDPDTFEYTDVLTGISVGSAVVTATLGTNNGDFTADTPVYVTDAQLIGIDVTSADSGALPVGLTRQYVATGTYSDGSVADLTSLAVWSIGPDLDATFDGAASVEHDGLATAVAQGYDSDNSEYVDGTVWVVASFGEYSAYSVLTITDPVVVALHTHPVNATVVEGDTEYYWSVVEYSDDDYEYVYPAGADDPEPYWMGYYTLDTNIATFYDADAEENIDVLNAEEVGSTAVIAWYWNGDNYFYDYTKVYVTDAELESITVEPTGIDNIPTLPVGMTQQYMAIGNYTDGGIADLTEQVVWDVEPNHDYDIYDDQSGDNDGENDPEELVTDNSGSATIDNNGLLTAVTEGYVTVTATLGEYAGEAVTDSAVLEITPAVVTGIQVYPENAVIVEGRSEGYIVDAIMSNGEDITIGNNWSADSLDAAGLTNANLSWLVKGDGNSWIQATNDGSGTIIAANDIISLEAKSTLNAATITGLEPGSTEILTRLNLGDIDGDEEYDYFEDYNTVYVLNAVLESISITPADPADLPAGLTQQFVATGIYSDSITGATSEVNLTETVVWVSSDTSVATIDAQGLATAIPQETYPATTNISCSLGDVASDAVTLTVVDPVVAGIVVYPDNALIVEGRTQEYVAYILYSDSSRVMVDNSDSIEWLTLDSETDQWVSANTIISIDDSAAPAIVVTGLEPGSATIRTVLTYDGEEYSDYSNVYVTSALLSEITISPSAPDDLPVGLTQQFTATGVYSDGTTANITEQVVWDSSLEALADIDAWGLATANGTGSTLISCSLYDIASDTVELDVVAPVLVSIEVSPAYPSVAKGNSKDFTATGIFSDGSSRTLTEASDATAEVSWTSSNTTVSTISVYGSAYGRAVGTTYIEATSTSAVATVNDLTISGGTVLTVTDPTLTKITVTPSSATIARGETQQYSATGTYSDSTTEGLTDQVVWTVSGSGGATIDPHGLAAGVAEGTYTITATLDGVHNHAALNVNDAYYAPSVTIPAEAVTTHATTYDISGRADAVGAIVKIYADLNDDGIADSTEPLAYTTATDEDDDNYFLTVALSLNMDNNFVITATVEDYAESAPVNVPTITQDAIDPVVYILSPVDDSVINTLTPDLYYGVVEEELEIHYILDGTTVDITGEASPVDLGTLSIGAHSLVLMATDLAGNTAVATSLFTIDPSIPSAPAASLDSGVYNTTKNVYLESQSQTVIYYTLDGEDPDTSSTLYDGSAIEISEDAVLKAIAVNLSLNSSQVAEFDYIIKTGEDLTGPTSQTITLEPGWNIFSVPKVVESSSFSTLSSAGSLAETAWYVLVGGDWITYSSARSTYHEDVDFAPLYGYAVQNNTGSSIDLEITYAASEDVSNSESLFSRTFDTTGWYTLGVASPEKALTQDCTSDLNVDTSDAIFRQNSVISQVIDYTGNASRSSVAFDAAENYISRVLIGDPENLINPRETRGYMVYVSIANSGFSGYQKR